MAKDRKKQEGSATEKNLEQDIGSKSATELIGMTHIAAAMLEAETIVLGSGAIQGRPKQNLCKHFYATVELSSQLVDTINQRMGSFTPEERDKLSEAVGKIKPSLPFLENTYEICSKPPKAETERAPERQRPTIPYSPHRIDI